MTSKRISRFLCMSSPRGDGDAIASAGDALSGTSVDAVCVVGDLAGVGRPVDAYRSVFKALADLDKPVYWVPGPDDAPVGDYLREAHNMEIVFGRLHGVHGSTSLTSDGHTVVAGLGGEVVDDPDAPREEIAKLRYPRWEAEYRLKAIDDEHQVVLLFATPPAHKGLGTAGSEALAELVATHRARLCVCGGARGTELIGRTLVVAPGEVGEGHYAIADLEAREAQLAG
jgi:Icc-related predicted phosphoesterase